MLNTLDGGQDADTVLSDISHLRDVLYTTYNQDLALGHRGGDLTTLAIADVIDTTPAGAKTVRWAPGVKTTSTHRVVKSCESKGVAGN